MRTVCIIFLVVLSMAASIRIDGVWPPPAIHEGLDSLLRHAAQPGMAVSALLDDRIRIAEQPQVSRGLSSAIPLEIAVRPVVRKPAGTECG